MNIQIAFGKVTHGPHCQVSSGTLCLFWHVASSPLARLSEVSRSTPKRVVQLEGQGERCVCYPQYTHRSPWHGMQDGAAEWVETRPSDMPVVGSRSMVEAAV